MSQPPLVTLIAGPTASGKSALALKMARETGAVIINADSQQLYADLRILTARPTIEEEAQADHRLYGVADAADAWSVGRWSRAVKKLLENLQDDGRQAIVIGGTGLYFTALTKGLADIPFVPLDVREALEATYQTDGEAAFRAKLEIVDQASACKIEKGDRQRMIRAMGVYTVSGRSLSDWKQDTQPLISTQSWKGIVVEPDRQHLYYRCDERAKLMMNSGAIDEVVTLDARNLPSNLPSMKAVGFQQILSFARGDTTRKEALESLAQSTRQYAKRQLTWFRNQTADWPRYIAKR
ncbi:tRNA (adenosine(37)-N6)-dimethylallyltransferase MiaA [Brevundimonas nasdae]|uniref:tRNA (adenosine(37)-N6)-dimethylallyltransferase MiaA n=1 Tax=Brevundimonas nasdae TaxID=172043 RepID=UPI003F68CDAD